MTQPARTLSEALRDDVLVAVGDEAGQGHPTLIDNDLLDGQTAAVRFTNNRAGGPDRGKHIEIAQCGPEIRDVAYRYDFGPRGPDGGFTFPTPRFCTFSEIALLILGYLVGDV